MILSVRERLPGLRPVISARDEMDSGYASLITLSRARLSSLSTSDRDFIEVNQIFGSLGLGLYLPRAMA